MSQPVDHTTKVQQLFVQEAASIKYFVLSLLPNPGEAEDLVQEVFLTVTAKAADFTEGSNFKAWAFTIARFKVLEFHRRQKWIPHSLSEATMAMLADEAAEIPDRYTIEKEQRLNQALSRCIKKLAPKAKLLVERVYEDGVKPGAVAKEIGWKTNAAYVALSRARSTLRTCLERQQPNSAL